MLKTNQKNVHAFEIEKQEPEAVMEFLEKNHALLQYFLIIFKYDIEPEVKAILRKHQLLFLETNRALNGRYIKTTGKDANLLKQNSPNAIEPKTTIYERNIRSGEEIYSANHLIFWVISTMGRRSFQKVLCQFMGFAKGRLRVLESI